MIASTLSTLCHVGTQPLSLFVINNRQHKEGREANHCIGVASELGSKSGHSFISCLILAQRYVCLSALYLYLSLSRGQIYPLEKLRLTCSEVRRTSCIFPEVVYVAVCVHCPHPLIF